MLGLHTIISIRYNEIGRWEVEGPEPGDWYMMAAITPKHAKGKLLLLVI